jgi:transcriptional antiterminator NusG
MSEVAAAEAMPTKSAIFAVKTTANQERSVANLIAMVTRKEQLDIRSVLVPEELKGYVLVESPMLEIVEQAITNIPHAKAVVRGASSIAEVQHFLAPKPTVTGISEGDIVELTAGPFKGEKARVQHIDEGKEEITVELFEALVPIPVTVKGDSVRVIGKEK